MLQKVVLLQYLYLIDYYTIHKNLFQVSQGGLAVLYLTVQPSKRSTYDIAIL